jgi:hypothetical protein
MYESDRVAWLQAIELLLHARQLANTRQVCQVEFELTKNAVERVVAADDEFDCLSDRLRDGRQLLDRQGQVQAERVGRERRRREYGRLAIRQNVGDSAADQWQE